ncbi:SRPBCC family protein [Micromonospora sp. C28SCA-DRY-2]|uniref:SRPBCC family protein n=1 Tax=Micromonospora sp. C28SCA-DRY-2 TaxID=3059522 RepID=UPI0026753B88|nr:SRPBCC family protein [Micromonospora sp. C28SCA-DRY-2]MDO3705061.1 SRPBCC family protein [Micromonospora sp. C28SCA-DRY-2]
MSYEETITTSVGPDRAWAAVRDVTAYPRWTASMSSVEPLDGPALAVGSRFRIRQPGLLTTVWRVAEVREGASFVWEATAPGVRTVGYHRVDRQPDGTARITIGIRQTGALAGLVALLIAAKTRRYVRMEAVGLAAAAEDPAAAGGGPAATGGR